ncbi:ribosome biogenesis GTPase YlqF [Salipaludibacillus neizhouensis]|uniref:Ribosome biogenesis GTPase A n=1 Tax=Salipaludibacillus neizhouensis TaxID=885475 RepID=A0A3A9KBI7_9BACI|nr:ribosome biogenesis GTPase YlqF [Salipaludibacillus neizhouensis]RKL68978.1 ribosome biogenesis GTPase YlqF [Salipaludibacillus neizhouensis]
MTIQWYPGHMAKARRQVVEKLKLIDVVIEIVDARIPVSSRNPMVDELTSHKPRLVLLNKADLADPSITKEWVAYFEKENWATLIIDAQRGKGIKDVPLKVMEQAKPLLDKFRSKGINPRAIRAMILGIPNVGKSTVINRLANKRITNIGDKPGVTKRQQWIKVGKEMELLDTPGILWPKFEDQDVGFRLAITGAIKEEIFDFQETMVFLLSYLKDEYPNLLKERYDLTELTEDVVDLFDAIGKRRGCLVPGGHVDYDRVAEIVFRDFRQGKLGNISLERPNK